VHLGGIDYVVIRPVMNYFSRRQVPREIVDQALQLITEDVRPLLSKSGVEVIVPEKARVVLGAVARSYTRCRACGLIGGVWADGRMYICTETNGFDGFAIGDLSEQDLKGIYQGERYRAVRSRVSRQGFVGCPLTCRPMRLNGIFEKIELLRSRGQNELLRRWVDALRRQHGEPNPWIEI
jgi:hypothetical protein